MYNKFNQEVSKDSKYILKSLFMLLSKVALKTEPNDFYTRWYTADKKYAKFNQNLKGLQDKERN